MAKSKHYLLCFYFIVFTNFLYLLFSKFDYTGLQSDRAGASLLYLALLACTYCAVIYQLILKRDVAFALLAKSTALWLFLLSSVISYLLAGASDLSVMRYVLYLLTISAGLLLASQYSLDDICEQFFYTGRAMLVLYFLMYPLFAGKIDYDELGRATLIGVTSYAGLFPHKNTAALVFSLVLIVSLSRFIAFSNSTTRRSSLIVIIGSMIAIVMAGAVGAFLTLIVSLGASSLCAAFLRARTSYLAVALALVLFAAIGLFAIGEQDFLEFFGRSTNLTGRTELYELWPYFFWQKPLFGYGFSGFFGSPGQAADYLSELTRGHGQYSTFESTYLDILIQFGLVGGMLLSWILLRALLNAVLIFRLSGADYRLFPLLFMVFTLIASILGSGLTEQNFIVVCFTFWMYFSRGENERPYRTAGSEFRIRSQHHARP